MSINSLSPKIRDEILKRNLILPPAVEENSLGGYAAGVGKPASIGDQEPSVKEVTSNSKSFREKIMGLNPYNNDEKEQINLYLEDTDQVGNKSSTNSQGIYQGPSDDGQNVSTIGKEERDDLSTLNPYQPTNGYYEVNIHNRDIENIGNLSDEERPKQYNGPDIDIRNNIASRTLNPNVQEDDTLIGRLADDYRNFNLFENISSNAEEETIGRINTNPLSLLTGNDLLVPNFTITVPKGKLGKAVDLGARILGFEVPVSVMSQSASIFYSENPVDNITRANEMLDNTGEGQVVTLINTMNQNKFKPAYEDSRVRQGLIQADKGTSDPNIYALGDGDGKVKDVLSEEASSPIAHSYKEDFNSEFDDVANDGEFWIRNRKANFTWADDKFNKDGQEAEPGLSEEGRTIRPAGSSVSTTIPLFANPDSILYKTNELFRTGEMKNLTAGKGLTSDKESSQIETPVEANGEHLISKGSGVKSQESIESDETTDPSNVFCRAWTTFDRYDQVSDLQKSSSLKRQVGNIERGDNIDESVLDDSGFARIGPRKDEEMDVKQYMLSIENLAWSEYTHNLPRYEIGPGDPLTREKGRIMWFPPYDVSVDDNVSVDWNSTKFIGRGEPIYTYNNTERIVTLGFKVIIDYPSYLEYIKGSATDDIFASVAAGCYDIADIDKNLLSVEERDQQEKAKKETAPQEKNDDADVDDDKFDFSVYFPNDVRTIPFDDTYEDEDDNDNDEGDNNVTEDEGVVSENKENTQNRTDFGKNKRWFELNNAKLSDLQAYLDEEEGECASCKVYISGYASAQGNDINRKGNNQLANERAFNLRNWFINTVGISENRVTVESATVKSGGIENIENADPDSEGVKELRKAEADIRYESSENEENEADPANASEEDQETNKNAISSEIANRILSEKQYFEKMKEQDSFIYENLSEKLKYFHPSFHSTTPEGFNARLTFLHQCTRQGNTDSFGGGKRPNNLAFGRQPYCILRVGDFFHTKVIIDNLNISFDPLQWDLNPEGVGVQPMIANVHLSMKAIGGASLKGPINVLQNAISYNFFANTEIYEPKSMRVKDNAYVREQDIELNQDTQNRRSASEEQGKETNKEEAEKRQQERNEQENTGDSNADSSSANGINALLKDSFINYYEDTNELKITLGKSRVPYNMEKEYTVKVFTQPDPSTDATFISPGKREVEDLNFDVPKGELDKNDKILRTITIDLKSTHRFESANGVDKINFDIILEAGDGIEATREVTLKKSI